MNDSKMDRRGVIYAVICDPAEHRPAYNPPFDESIPCYVCGEPTHDIFDRVWYDALATHGQAGRYMELTPMHMRCAGGSHGV